MTNKLHDPKTAEKTNWTILDQLLYNKQFSAIPPLLVDGKFVSILEPEQTFFFCFDMYTN